MMTATWTRDEILTWFDCRTLTAGELALAPHDLDPTCTRATLETGEVYRWDNRRSVWVRNPEVGMSCNFYGDNRWQN